MKAEELNGTHLGKLVMVTDVKTDRAVAGTLSGVSHETSLIADGSFATAEPTQHIGRRWVILEFIGETRSKMPMDATVVVEDEITKPS